MPTLRMTGAAVTITPTVLDTEDGRQAVPSISIEGLPAWLYTSEAKRLGRKLIKVAERTEMRAKKRTNLLKQRRKRRPRG